MGWGVAGGAYIGIAGIGFLYLRAMEPHGLITALWVFLVVAAADVGGYFAGRLIGGPKLWPRVSPNKTWAGTGGGAALAIGLGGLFSWATTGTYYLQVCTVSAAAAVLSQGGDLAESALKRHFGVKDSGRLLPGHGGALDRFDGLLAAVLAVALIAWWRGQTVFIW
jgi:phosphatidate cytidylyltransferase